MIVAAIGAELVRGQRKNCVSTRLIAKPIKNINPNFLAVRQRNLEYGLRGFEKGLKLSDTNTKMV